MGDPLLHNHGSNNNCIYKYHRRKIHSNIHGTRVQQYVIHDCAHHRNIPIKSKPSCRAYIKAQAFHWRDNPTYNHRAPIMECQTSSS